jgi:phosphoglycolate phosphatase
MTRVAVDLADLLAPGRCILLDFDGPVCNLFRGQLTGAAVVERLAAIVIDSGLCRREQIPATEDSLQVLRLAHQLDLELANEVNTALAQAEIEAAQTAPPTRHAAEFIRTATQSGRGLAIVSNNSAGAIETFLNAHNLAVDVIVGRADADPSHLKPSSYLLHRAIAELASEPSRCTLIGDSASDIIAALSLDIASIGYANTPAKSVALTDAGADVVVHDVRTLTRWLIPLGTAAPRAPSGSGSHPRDDVVVIEQSGSDQRTH